MTYHIIIQQERRTARQTPMGEDRSRLALGISTAVPTGNTINGPMGDMPEYVAGPEQLHISATQQDIYSGRIRSALARGDQAGAENLREQAESGATPDFGDPQYVGVFEWDGRAPYVIAHKGDYSAVTMRYAGWPEITKEQLVSQQADQMEVS